MCENRAKPPGLSERMIRMKYGKTAAVVLTACLLLSALSACKSGGKDKTGGKDASSTQSYSVLYMPSYPAQAGSDTTGSAPDLSGVSSAGEEPDNGMKQVVSAETVSSAGSIKTRREALDVIKDRVIPIRFKNVPTLEYQPKENATGKYKGTMEVKDSATGTVTKKTVYLDVQTETTQYYRVVYYAETPNTQGGRSIVENLGAYQVYKDGRVKDVNLEEFIGIKKK